VQFLSCLCSCVKIDCLRIRWRTDGVVQGCVWHIRVCGTSGCVCGTSGCVCGTSGCVWHIRVCVAHQGATRMHIFLLSIAAAHSRAFMWLACRSKEWSSRDKGIIMQANKCMCVHVPSMWLACRSKEWSSQGKGIMQANRCMCVQKHILYKQ